MSQSHLVRLNDSTPTPIKPTFIQSFAKSPVLFFSLSLINSSKTLSNLWGNVPLLTMTDDVSEKGKLGLASFL